MTSQVAGEGGFEVEGHLGEPGQDIQRKLSVQGFARDLTQDMPAHEELQSLASLMPVNCQRDPLGKKLR